MASGNPADIGREPYTATSQPSAPPPDRHAALDREPARYQATDDWPEQVRRRADELVATAAYPNWTQAWRAAYREVTERQRRALEEQVLTAAAKLDPADTSPGAQLRREAAASIGDHRSNDTMRRRWLQPEAAAQAAPTPVPGNPARIAAASFATPAASAAGAGAAAASAGSVRVVPPSAAAARAADSTSPGRSR
jgi:hypothetical protein